MPYMLHFPALSNPFNSLAVDGNVLVVLAGSYDDNGDNGNPGKKRTNWFEIAPCILLYI
jgi:hypothetical protein